MQTLQYKSRIIEIFYGICKYNIWSGHWRTDRIVKELHYFKYWYVMKSSYNSNGYCFINIKLSELKIQSLCLLMRLFKSQHSTAYIPVGYKSTALLLAPSRPEAQQCQHPVTTFLPRGVYLLPRSRDAGRCQTSMNCCCCSRSQLGCSGSENRTTKGPGHGPILEVETGQRPERKDIADRSPTYKSYWAQWNSLAVRNGMLERNWESADGLSHIAQIVLPRSREKDVLSELHGGPSGGHVGVGKTLNKARQNYYWLQARNDIEKWCRQCNAYAPSRCPRTRNRGQIHQYNVVAPFERIAIGVTGPFPRSDQGNRCLLIAVDFMNQPEAYSIPNQETSTVVEAVITNFWRFGILRELHSDQGRNFESRLLQEVLQRLGVSKTHTYERSLHPTRVFGTKDYPSFS
jgi:hypothetical protein